MVRNTLTVTMHCCHPTDAANANRRLSSRPDGPTVPRCRYFVPHFLIDLDSRNSTGITIYLRTGTDPPKLYATQKTSTWNRGLKHSFCSVVGTVRDTCRAPGEYKNHAIGVGANTPIVARSPRAVINTLITNHPRLNLLSHHWSSTLLALFSPTQLPFLMMEPTDILPAMAPDQREEEPVSTPTPETAEDAPPKPSKAAWKTGEQLEYLYSQWPNYLAHRGAKASDRFWPRIFDQWHRTWKTQPTPDVVELHGSVENAILALRAKTNKVRALCLAFLYPLLTPLIRGSAPGSTTRDVQVLNPPSRI